MEEKYVAQVTIKVSKMVQTMMPRPDGQFQPMARNPVAHVLEATGEGKTPLGAVAVAFGELQLAIDAGVTVSVEEMFKKAFTEEQAEKQAGLLKS